MTEETTSTSIEERVNAKEMMFMFYTLMQQLEYPSSSVFNIETELWERDNNPIQNESNYSKLVQIDNMLQLLVILLPHLPIRFSMAALRTTGIIKHNLSYWSILRDASVKHYTQTHGKDKVNSVFVGLLT